MRTDSAVRVRFEASLCEAELYPHLCSHVPTIAYLRLRILES